MNEVMFWAEKLKRRFMEKMSDKKDDAEHQTDVGAEKEEESAGDRHNGLHTYKILYPLFRIENYMCCLNRAMWGRDEQFLGTVWRFARG